MDLLKLWRNWIVAEKNPLSATHAARTAVAALVSLLLARSLGLPEFYWAGITTLVVVQSTLGASLPISLQQFAGTAVGAAIGGWADAYFPGNIFVFAACVLGIGIAFAPLRVELAAYRNASITLAIVMLVRAHSGWTLAIHRFLDVSLGIAVGVAVSALWPESAWRSHKTSYFSIRTGSGASADRTGTEP
jgi:uncharacterized membrane protein YgaE (UPF0421/DUF939 family)